MWCGLWVEFHLFWFRWWFLALCHPFEQMFSSWGWMNLKVGCDPSFFPHWGRYHLVSKAHTYQQSIVLQSDLHWPFHHQIHCHKCANRYSPQTWRQNLHDQIHTMSHNIEWYIYFNEVGTCKKNGNLMFAQVSTQCLFTCATNILGERKWDLICHIWMLLISYHPCMVGFVWIIYFMGDMHVRDQYDLFNICFHNVFHNLFFYEPTCVVCYTIHNGGHYLLEHLQMFVLLEFYTIYRSMFVIFSCHNFLNLLIVFWHPLIPWLCFLYVPSPISVPRAPFTCCLSKFFLQAFNPSSLSIPIPCLLNQHS